MAEVSADQIQIGGTAPTYNAASSGGDKVPPGDRTVLHVKNDSGSSIDCTIVTPGTVLGQDISDVVVSVPASGERFAGPLPYQELAGDDGLVDVTWSATTSVTFAVVRV